MPLIQHLSLQMLVYQPFHSRLIFAHQMSTAPRTDTILWKKAIQKLDLYLSDEKNKLKFLNILENAKKRFPSKGAECAHLQNNLKSNSAIRGITGKCRQKQK